MTRGRQKPRRREGRSLVELALVINLLLMVVLSIFEYGHIIMIKQLLDNAAREGARLAVVSTNTDPATTTAQIQAYVTKYLVGQPVKNLSIQVYEADTTNGNLISSNWSGTPFGMNIAVQVDADYPPMISAAVGIIPNPLHMTAKSVMRSEAN